MADEPLQPYKRIVRDVETKIRSGRLGPHDRLPSSRELAATHGVSLGTVQRALAELRTTGLIYSHQGRGIFISERSQNLAHTGDDPSTALAFIDLQRRVSDLETRLQQLESKI